MRVGIITDTFPPEVGGIQTYADQFVSQLAASPDIEHVHVLAFTAGTDEEREDVSIRRIGTNNTPQKLISGLGWFRKRSLDVVHSLTLYPGGLLASLCKKMDDSVSAFSTVYGLDAISLVDHPILGPIHRLIFDSLDEVLFFSDSTREKTHRVYNASFRSRTIYPGAPQFPPELEADECPVPEPTESEDFVVLTVARLVERKGIDDLITAVANTKSVSLWIVGDGPQRESLEQHAADTAPERITFFGEVDHDKLPSVYERADVFCMPSVYLESEGDIEGLGLVFLEAQQFGLPVIGTRSGGIPEALSDWETGFLVDERSPDQIRECIEKLKNDPKLYQKFSEEAVSFVEEQFAWRECIKQHLQAYQQS